jgi:pre-mRNA-processing factor 17
MRNHLGAAVERTHIADFHFEEQFQTFNSFGFAMDPSAAFNAHRTGGVVGNLKNYQEMSGRTVHQATKRDAKKRKLDGDVALQKALTGRGTELTAEEAEECAKDLEIVQAKEKVEADKAEEAKKKVAGISEATSIFHGKKEVDYQVTEPKQLGSGPRSARILASHGRVQDSTFQPVNPSDVLQERDVGA